MSPALPRVASLVCFVLEAREVRPAVVTRVHASFGGLPAVNLQVVLDGPADASLDEMGSPWPLPALSFRSNVPHCPNLTAGTWHWPEEDGR